MAKYFACIASERSCRENTDLQVSTCLKILSIFFLILKNTLLFMCVTLQPTVVITVPRAPQEYLAAIHL
jgi:hypothetical protein